MVIVLAQSNLAARAVEETTGTEQATLGDVLIVDDSRAHLRLMATVLSRWGYSVRTAERGAEALEILADGEIGIVISDWIMPEMSGIELCETFRGQHADRYVYFILLTSKTDGEDVATGLAAGADDFLTKPLDRNELRARITAGERLIKMQHAVVEKNRLLESTLNKLQSVYDAVARDLVEARRLQQSLVPERQLSYDGADVSLLLQPSGHVGGDIVGAFQDTHDRLAVYSIDVSGHGIASALLNARLAGYLSPTSPAHNLALKPDGTGGYQLHAPDEICQRLNALLIADLETELYFTMSFAVIDLGTGAVELSQAGHPNPMIQRKFGAVEFPGDGGMPIGLLEDAVFGTIRFELEPGDRVFLYTDGFTEQVDPEGVMLEETGLTRLAKEFADAPGQDFLDALVWSLSNFAGERDFDDDLSGALIEYKGQASD